MRPVFPGFLLVTLIACGACSEDESSTEAEGSASEEARVVHLDLVESAHLADVDHQGLYIDFGTPAQNKYTVGSWRSGFGSQGADGDTTYVNVERRARIYFHSDDGGPMHVRVRLRPKGPGSMSPYINNEQLQAVFFEGEDWQTLDIALPAEHTKVGENYFLLAFGGVANIGGEDVSVQIASMRVSPGTDAPSGDYEAPAWGTIVSQVALGGDTRRALAYGAPTRFTYYTQVPQGGALSFRVGQEGAAGGTARVFARPEGGERTKLWEGTLGASWAEQNVDLSRFAGNVIQLTLEGEGGEGRVAWADARIVTPAEEAPEIEPAQNVVVVLCDTLRASKLRPWNRETRVQTPVLNELAEGSAVFERGISTENWTKPAVASILTGLHPIDHMARTQSAVLSDSALMLSEHMKAQGLATAGFIANGYISDRFGFDQGWDRYKNFIREEGASSEAEVVFREAADWAVEHKDERFFLYVHTIDPHVPYDPEQEFVSMYDPRPNYDGQVRPRMTGELLAAAKGNEPTVRFTPSDVIRLEALHDGEITQHDRHMGTFINRLKEAGIWENTVFVFVADHGEEFNEHGQWGHGHSIYEELLHVPLLVHRSGAIPARRISTTVSTMDIAPTVLELAGLPPMPNIAAQSLVPLIYGQQRGAPPMAMSEFLDERRVITAGRWKWIMRGNLRHSMFDLQEDPGEQTQLDIDQHPIAGRWLRVHQGQFLGAANRAQWMLPAQEAGPGLNAGEVQMDDELQQQLRELGYLN